MMNDPDLIRAVAVHDELRGWCDSFSEGVMPCPWVNLAGDYVSLGIGDFTIWDTESGYADELNDDCEEAPTFKRCVGCYKRLIEMASAWPVRPV